MNVQRPKAAAPPGAAQPQHPAQRARAMPGPSPVHNHTWWLTVMRFAQREETDQGRQQLLLAPANDQPAVLCSESDGPQRRSVRRQQQRAACWLLRSQGRRGCMRRLFTSAAHIHT